MYNQILIYLHVTILFTLSKYSELDKFSYTYLSLISSDMTIAQSKVFTYNTVIDLNILSCNFTYKSLHKSVFILI